MDESELCEDPIQQFLTWFEQSKQADDELPDWYEKNAMTLATSSLEGEVTARVVLLKGADQDGFVFYTSYDSSKAQQLAENARAALVLFWPHLERQVRIEGTVSKTNREDSEKYFHSRPRGSQIGAAISPQSESVKDRSELEKRWADYEEQLGDAPVPLPDNWGGYRVRPSRIEFWQGRENRLHDRLVYGRSGDEWIIERLAP